MKRVLAVLFCVLAALPGAAFAADVYESEHYRLRVETFADGLVHPWGLTFLPDGRILVTERPGRIRIVSHDGALSPPLDGLPEIWARGQGGALDIEIDPDFETNRLVYFSYAEPGPGGAGTAVARGRLDEAANRLRDVEVIFRQQPKSSGGRHFGSRLVFSPEGKLFITIGERGERQRTQNFTINRGQVIRINPDGSIPPDNPFVGKEGYLPEVWSYGHRNPQGAARHPETGKLWIHEHGARGGDEVNVPEAGKNYGWPVISYGRHYSGGKIGVGTHKEGMEQPIYYWDPSIAPSGMDFYTGDKFPDWQGDLLVGALKFQLLVRLELEGREVVHEERMLEALGERIRAVEVGPEGYVYLLTDASDGRILRLAPAAR
ncbi:MAG: PQQ-dependent sugar dehydrogenase [Rhodovibrionaceae bacterium]|nr:PQQ-dependent sugar dehydrogenase [Rhodovibrionaceae bacterium]